jgi:hypothetical protein
LEGSISRSSSLLPKKTTRQFTTVDAKISVVYVQTLADYPVDNVLLDKVQHGLTSISSTMSGETIYLRLSGGRSKVVAIPSDKLKLNCGLAFAIIDDTHQAKGTTQQIVSRLHQFADRQAGVLLVCATRSHLMGLFKGPLKSSDKYFPASLRAKINYKLRGTNFEAGLHPLVADQGLMIASGHIAHRNTSHSYNPSISAIVATRDDACSQYLGSIRFGPATKYLATKTPLFERRAQVGLQDLQAMMVERFKKSDAPPTKILFFRDSLNFDEESSDLEDHCKMIKKAYEFVFPNIKSPIRVTFVVVNKNTEIKKVPTESMGKTAVPIFDYVLDGHATAKYRYYVIKNEIGWSKEELTALVSPQTALSYMPYVLTHKTDPPHQPKLTNLDPNRHRLEVASSELRQETVPSHVRLLQARLLFCSYPTQEQSPAGRKR